MRVWVVVGEYFSCGCDGSAAEKYIFVKKVFTDEAKAEAFAKERNDDGNDEYFYFVSDAMEVED